MAMTPVKIAEHMDRAIKALGVEGQKSTDLITAKADAMANYDKLLGVAVARLKMEGVQTTIIEKQAKGECAEALYSKVIAEESLKAHYSRMEQLKAQLNGLQSMNRHLDSLPENKG